MVHRLPWALALATCGVWGCAAISGLDGLDLGGDASTIPDATTFDAPGDGDAPDADATAADASGNDADAGVADTGADAGCASGKPCPGTQTGCCTQYETCSNTKPPVCCKSNGSYCNGSGECCPGSVCTAGGTCQTSCSPLDAGCQTGSQDKCCRGQAFCLSLNGSGSCVACKANDAGFCSGDQQCCSHNCSSGVCKP